MFSTASYSSLAPALASATRIRRNIATAQSHNFRVITNKGTSGSFSRVKCNCRRSEDILTKLATDTTNNDAVVSRLIVA